MSFCNDYRLLSVIYIIKIIFKLLSIMVPILLLVSLIITFCGYILNGEVKYNFKDIMNNAVKKIISAVIIFLVPTIITLVLDILDTDNYKECFDNATIDVIEAKKAEKKAKEQLEYEKILKTNEKAEEEARKNNSLNNSTNVGTIDNSNYTTPGSVNSVNIVSINVTDLPARLYYSSFVVDSVRVNSEIAGNMKNILMNVSKYVNSNPFIGNFSYAGAYMDKAGYHGRGLAIDLFNNWNYNGHKPYSGQGYNTWNRYVNFLCTYCNGQENCKYNINYIIYERYFKGNGWCWGGNWGPEYFDPMHYELTDGGCYTGNKQKVSCGGN